MRYTFRYLALIAALTLSFTLNGCGAEETPNDQPTKQTSNQTKKQPRTKKAPPKALTVECEFTANGAEATDGYKRPQDQCLQNVREHVKVLNARLEAKETELEHCKQRLDACLSPPKPKSLKDDTEFMKDLEECLAHGLELEPQQKRKIQFELVQKSEAEVQLHLDAHLYKELDALYMASGAGCLHKFDRWATYVTEDSAALTGMVKAFSSAEIDAYHDKVIEKIAELLLSISQSTAELPDELLCTNYGNEGPPCFKSKAFLALELINFSTDYEINISDIDQQMTDGKLVDIFQLELAATHRTWAGIEPDSDGDKATRDEQTERALAIREHLCEMFINNLEWPVMPPLYNETKKQGLSPEMVKQLHCDKS